MDMRGLPLAAALDLDTTVALEREVRDLPDDFQYFNAGVLLADLSVWRQEAIGDQLLAFAKAAAKLPFSDQSTINLVLQRRILPLERALNFISMDFIASVPDPIVIHHAGWLKPWRAPWSAFHDLYRFHRSQTPWPLPETSHVGLMLKKGRRRAAAILGIPRYRKLAEEMRVHEAARRSVGLPALQRARDLLARASFTGQGMA
jgi:hypothetical protein